MSSPTQTSFRSQAKPCPVAVPGQVRVAIYTRKSIEASAEQKYNSLEAQRDAVLRYIHMKESEGWHALPDVYEDNGFTGANTNRPAYQRLREDIARGGINVLAIYRLDRITRSQKDLHEFLSFLRKHGVDLISITENFDTATPHGRAMISFLGTFSELERETIAERTRDKVAEARRKGHWTGGRVPLGYSLKEKTLVPCLEEAPLVRGIFQLYLDLGSLRAVVREANQRGWRKKEWISKAGRESGGGAIDTSWLHRLLTNPVYRGKVKYNGEVFDGRHEAIVDEETWQLVQDQLSHNDHTRGRSIRNKWGALLKGLLRCGRCGAPMGHTWTGNGSKRYRYYVCQTAQLHGADACPDARVNAQDVETAVVGQIQALKLNTGFVSSTLEALRKRGCSTNDEVVAKALEDFDSLWSALPPLQRARLLELLLNEVKLDPETRELEVGFREPVLIEIAMETDES